MIGSDEVLRALGEIQQTLKINSSPGHFEILIRELQELSASIMETRCEIAAIKPEEPSDRRIIAATGELLDAIVTATERATTDIPVDRIQVDNCLRARLDVESNADAVRFRLERDGPVKEERGE